MFENKDIKKGPVGKWDETTRRAVGYSRDFDKWIDEAYAKSPKVVNEFEFVAMWRQAFMSDLEEVG
jgi:hypothetical protein